MYKLNNVPVDLKKIIDAVSKEVVKKTKFNKLNMKVNILEKKYLWVYFNSDKSKQHK